MQIRKELLALMSVNEQLVQSALVLGSNDINELESIRGRVV